MTRKRIPSIKLNLSYPDETSHLILGAKILFIRLAYDTSPSNPLEDSDGMGSIDAVGGRGKYREEVISMLWGDRDAVALDFRDYGSGGSKWQTHPDEEDIFASICAARTRKRLSGEDPDDWGTVGFEPDWSEKIDGIWTPDQSTRESYMGQDGLTRREWMVKQAESACETYTDYCNGNVYGYDIQLHTLRKDDDGDPITDFDYYEHHKALEEDSCWGFYGWDYFKDEVLGIVKGFLKDLKFSRRAIDAAIKEAA